MFTKLKNKIAEEVKQSPLKLTASVQQLAQAVVSPSSSSVVEPVSNDQFSIGDDSEETPQNSPSKSGGFHSVDLRGEVPVSSPIPPGGRSRRSSTCSVSSETSSLFPIFETSVMNSFTPQSDLESASEIEDTVGHQLGAISKEQLYSAYRKMQSRYAKYKGRYADLARHYRELDRDNVKAKTILAESQDKALRRIAELKEQCQLEQKAKAHLEDALRNDLEEKDHLISTLFTKIELLKLNGGKEVDSDSQRENSSDNLLIDLSTDQNSTVSANPSPLPPDTEAANKEKMKKLELLLSRCKESIKRNKDRISQLTSENQQLQETLEKTKVSSSSQLKTLTEDLTAAQREIVTLGENLKTLHKREEDAALSLAENKLTIHRELEAKEEQIKSLRDTLTQLTVDKEALVERATSLQNEVTDLKSAASMTSTVEDMNSTEEDRQNLIQELSRGKAEAVRLLQQEMQKKLIDLEDKMSDKLRTTENKNSQLIAEIEALKTQIEVKEHANNELEQRLLSFKKENNSSETVNNNYGENSKLEVILKDLEQQLHVAQNKLLEKETMIRNMEVSAEHLVESHNNQLFELESKVKAEITDKLQMERENEIMKLNNKFKEEIGEKLKIVGNAQSQLDLELLKKSETEKKNKDLLNQIGNMESALKSKESEINSLSSEIVTLKEITQNLESKLKQTSEDYRKAKKEKENVSLAFVLNLNSVKEIRSSLQILRNNVLSTLISAKDDVCTMGSQISDIFESTQKELSKVKDELQDKKTLENKLRTNVIELERELNEQKESFNVAGNLENMLEELRISKKKLELELLENDALVKKLQHKLENTLKTSETREQELSQLHNSINGLQHELAAVALKSNTDLSNLKNEYAIKLEEKESECNDLQIKFLKSHDKVQNLQNNLNNSEKKLIEVSANYDLVKQENEKLHNLVKELEAKSEVLKVEVTAVDNERTRLSATVQELSSISSNEIIGLKDKIESLTRELSNSNEEKTILSSQLEETSQKILKFNNDIKLMEDAWKDKIKLLNERIKGLEHSLHSGQEKHKWEIQNFEDKISTLNCQLKESHKKEDELLTDVEKLREEILRKNSNNKHEASDYEKCISNLQAQLDESHQMAQELSTRVESIKKENSSQKQILENRQSEVENMAAERKSILSKLQDLEAELFMLIEQKDRWSGEKTCLEMKEKELEESNSNLENKLSSEIQERMILEEQYKRLKEDNEDMTKQLEKLCFEVKHLEENNTATNISIENLKLERNSLAQSIVDVDYLKKEHVNKIEALGKEVNNLKSENRNLNIALDETLKELEEFRKEMVISRKNIVEESNKKFEKIEAEKCSLEKQFINVAEEKKSLEEQLIMLKKDIESNLREKTDLEQKFNNTLTYLEEVQVKMKTDQEHYGKDVDRLKQELENTLKEKEKLEHKLKDRIENSKKVKETTSSNIEKLHSEKEQLEQQLDNTLLDLQAKEKQVAELEEIHTQKIKQLVRNFERQLAEKNEELNNLEDKKFERQEQEENLKIREFREHAQELQEASQAQDEAYRQLHQKHENAMQEKQTEYENLEQKTKELQAVHQQELTKADERWRQYLEQQLAEAEVRHKEELMELSKEWHWERKNSALDTQTSEQKELESTSQLAVAAVESGTGSIELLHRQLVAQTIELKEAKRLHKLEVAELRRLLSLRRQSGSSDRTQGHSMLEDACTELEYLKNILYEYMMGKEPVVLARVIAAVVKFDADQTTKVLQKEEQKQTLLGQLGIL